MPWPAGAMGPIRSGGATVAKRSFRRGLGRAAVAGGVGYGLYSFGRMRGRSSGANGIIPNSSGGMGAANPGYGIYGY